MVWKPSFVSWESSGKKRQRDLRDLWTRGDLRWKLDPDQREIYDSIKSRFAQAKSSAERWFALDIGRRYGKDFIMAALALETMMKAKPRARIAYGAPTGDACEEIVSPIILAMLDDCPPDLRPIYKSTKHRFLWSDGRRIVLIGCDLHPQRLRGTGSIAIFLTEPAFMTNLDIPSNGVMAAIEAQLIDDDNAYRVYGSTPPETPAHPWTTKYIMAAKQRGNYAHRTTYDSPRYTKEQVDGFVSEAGGPTSSRARREYFAEHVVEETLMIVPEWVGVRNECIAEIERPKYADCYESLDPGWTAFSVGLFAYWHFERQVLVVEDDFGETRANTARIAESLTEKERLLWSGWPRYFDGKLIPQPYKRVSDIDQRLIADLWAEHGVLVLPTEKKDTLDTEVAHFRLHVQNKKIFINPRCKTLISHLDHGIWNKSRTSFAESAECGHFDAIAAAMYLDRNIERAKNPFPPNSFTTDYVSEGVSPAYKNEINSQAGKALAQAFSRRRSLRRVSMQ